MLPPCAHTGGVKRRIRLWRAGSWGATQGANTAAPITAKRMRAPARAAGLRASLRHAREPSAPRTESPPTATLDVSYVPMDTEASAHPDLRVEVDVEEVDGEIHQHHDEGEDEDSSLDDGEVQLANGADDEPAQSGHREHGLSDDGAAEEDTELEPSHGDERQGGVDQGVVPDDDPLGDPLGARRAHVVEVDHFEHA